FLGTLDFVNFLLTAAAQESKMSGTSELCWGLLFRGSGIVWRGVRVGEHAVSIMVVFIHPRIFDNEFVSKTKVSLYVNISYFMSRKQIIFNRIHIRRFYVKTHNFKGGFF
ncbi:unnamed protein product, partial [Brassica oleracea]